MKHLFQSPGMVMLVAARDMQTHTRMQKLLGQEKRRNEEAVGETIQTIKANMLSECKLIVLFSPQPRSHLLFYVTLPPSLPPPTGGRGVADTLRGSLCYLETDSLCRPANQRLWKTASRSSIGPLLPGNHSTINGCVILSSGSAEANYTAPFLCSDLFSPA